jgi:hypothetical protein
MHPAGRTPNGRPRTTKTRMPSGTVTSEATTREKAKKLARFFAPARPRRCLA